MAIVLIFLPAAVLSDFGFLSVNERARNLETGYRGTLDKSEFGSLCRQMRVLSQTG